MLKKRTRKKQFILAALYICVNVLLAGCGKKEQKNTELVLQEQKDCIYVAETEDFINTDSISCSCSFAGKLYLSTYNEEKKDNRAFVIDLATRESMPMRLPLEKNADSVIAGMAFDPDGSLVFVECCVEDAAGEQNDRVYIKTCPAEGRETLSVLDITDQVTRNGSGYMPGFAIDRNHNYYLFSDKTIRVLDPQGKLLSEAQLNIKWFADIAVMKDGQAAFLAAADNGAGFVLGVVNPETQEITYAGENVFTDQDAGGDGRGMLAASNTDSADLFISCNGKVYGYKHKEGLLQEEFNWLDSNINNGKVRDFISVDAEHFAAVTSESTGEGYETQIVYLTQSDADAVPARETLVLAAFYCSDDLREMVAYFNQNQEQYQVEIKNYLTSTSDSAQKDAHNKLVLDILSGKTIDMVDGSALNVQRFASAGVYEDLTPYLSRDEDLQDVEFFPSVMEANTVDGKLVCIPDSFAVDTLVGGVSEFGGVSGLTLDEYMEREKNPFLYCSQESLLTYFVSACMEQYVDWDTGNCGFDSESFKKVLEYIKDAGYSAQDNSLSEDREYDKTQLQFLWIYNGPSMKYYESSLIKEPMVYVGYPIADTASSNGSRIENLTTIHMLSTSNNKEGVWEFIRYFLMPEYYQEQLLKNPVSVAFSPRKDLYEGAFDKWMEGDASYTPEDEPVTPEDKQIITEVIENAGGANGYDSDIDNIILEEAGAYFAGQKSVDEVAAIIQSRVQLYVNENR